MDPSVKLYLGDSAFASLEFFLIFKLLFPFYFFSPWSFSARNKMVSYWDDWNQLAASEVGTPYSGAQDMRCSEKAFAQSICSTTAPVKKQTNKKELHLLLPSHVYLEKAMLNIETWVFLDISLKSELWAFWFGFF